jgi:hypothetical protein
MKFAPKCPIGFSLPWQTLVVPGHGILLGLLSPFLIDEVETLIIIGSVSLS